MTMTFDVSRMSDEEIPATGAADAVMRFLRRNQEALLSAADCAARLYPESTEQRAVVVLDMSEERSRAIVRIGVEAGVVPEAAASDCADAMILVVTADAARKLVEEASSIQIDRFDHAARYSAMTRGMMIVVLSCGTTLLGCLPRSGAEIARA